MAQLMPLPLTVSCFSKIHIGFTFLVPAHPGSPGKRAVKRMCVCVCLRSVKDLSQDRPAIRTPNGRDIGRRWMKYETASIALVPVTPAGVKDIIVLCRLRAGIGSRFVTLRASRARTSRERTIRPCLPRKFFPTPRQRERGTRCSVSRCFLFRFMKYFFSRLVFPYCVLLLILIFIFCTTTYCYVAYNWKCF